MNIPTLIIHGREDKAIPLDRSKKLNDLWKGSKLVIFDKAGHSPHEEYPEKFNKLALEFLSENNWGSHIRIVKSETFLNRL